MCSIRRRELRSRAPGAAAFASFALAALVLGGACKDPSPHPRWQGAGADANEPHHGGTLHILNYWQGVPIDPHAAVVDFPNLLVFDTLVDYVPGTAEKRAGLAERWESSSDGRVWRFFLREGVRFHDGRLLVADDVKASFERLLDPDGPSGIGSYFDRIVGFDDFRKHRAAHLEGIVVVDARTVEIHLTQPDASMLDRLTIGQTAIVPVDVTVRLGRERFGQAPIGTGPFALESWEEGTRMVFRKNAHYWRARAGLPYLDRIVVDLNMPQQLATMRFQRGDLDIALVNGGDRVWFLEQPQWRDTLTLTPTPGLWALCMNTELSPWNNRALRRAVAAAIDRGAAARAALGAMDPIGVLYPPGIAGHDPNVPWAQRFDPEAARREMAAAGFPSGLPDEQELWMTMDARVGALVQADLARIGIRVRIRLTTDFATIARRGAVGMAFVGMGMSFPDPIDFTEPFFHSRNISEEGSLNTAFYANPALDTLLDRARGEGDGARRLTLYRDAERIILEDAPCAFVGSWTWPMGTQPYVRNYHQSFTQYYDVREVWLDEPRRAWTPRGTR